MAWKRIAGNTAAGQLNFEAEQRILQQFKSCLENNKNIMQSFASFVHGPDFIILSRWADGRDLHLFLTKPDEILDNYPAKSIRFSPDNLLTEAYNLARALHFLHFGMATWARKTAAMRPSRSQTIEHLSRILARRTSASSSCRSLENSRFWPFQGRGCCRTKPVSADCQGRAGRIDGAWQHTLIFATNERSRSISTTGGSQQRDSEGQYPT